ncbi:hypothetical protein [Nocardia barduliensis]|uniref:hypothetical protein n=1 Tax=Nocardia barduliensis TaxID=2736643 RepID=UPI0015743535|nr:hypothetical protein [Nocardia barduliensis]
MAFDADARPDRPSHRGSWHVIAAGIVGATAAALLGAVPAAAQPASSRPSDSPVEVPIPGGFEGFSGILRFLPPAPPQPQMPLGRPLPDRGPRTTQTTYG